VDWIADWVEKIDQMFDAIEHAKACGTLNAADRSKQYPLQSEKQIIDAVNLALTKARINERALAAKADNEHLRRQLRNYRLINIALTSIITGLAWEGIRALVPWVMAALGH
jgi:hypothetical protein